MSIDRAEDGVQFAIAIADAVDLLQGPLGGIDEARRVLVQRAQIGDLRAYAARAHGFFDDAPIDEHDWLIPADLWLRLGNHSESEWRLGDLTAEYTYDRHAELHEVYGSPLRLIGVRVELKALERVAASLPIVWVDAHGAIDMLLPMFGAGMRFAASKALAKRAHNGLLRTRAKLFKWEELDRGPYHSDRKVERQSQFAPLPKQFWWAEGEKALTQNWILGDFSTWIGRELHWQAFGVEFARCDIRGMIPQSRQSIHEDVQRGLEVYLNDGSQHEHEHLPSEAAIENKMQELTNLGMSRDVAAKAIRQIRGFERVGNEHARRAVKGKLPLGRPRKSPK